MASERFVRFACEGVSGVGRIKGELIEALPFDSMRECIKAGFKSEEVKFTVELSKARFLPPVIPSKIICLGWNYAEHVEELKNKIPNEPMIFYKPSSALVGHEAEIVLPPKKLSKEVNNEVELAVVVGKSARNVKAADAFKCVGGYTIMQDITARDVQRRLRAENMQWEVAKSFDTFAPLGPWIIPKKFIKNPQALDISLRVNGKVRQDSNTKHMIFKVPKIIEYLSSVMTLQPGDVISTGTPKGVDLIKAGDELEAEIQGIGVLKNTVARS